MRGAEFSTLKSQNDTNETQYGPRFAQCSGKQRCGAGWHQVNGSFPTRIGSTDIERSRIYGWQQQLPGVIGMCPT